MTYDEQSGPPPFPENATDEDFRDWQRAKLQWEEDHSTYNEEGIPTGRAAESYHRGKPGTWQYLAIWKYGSMEVKETLSQFKVNDQDTAILLSKEFPGWFRYASPSGRWFLWDDEIL